MKFVFKIYITLISVFLLSSCADDLLKYGNEGTGNGSGNSESEYAFALKIDDCALRTRDVNFQEGASLRLNKVWLGVFDIETGTCVSNNTFSMDYVPITSGQYRTGVVRVDLKDPAAAYENDEFIMVCVANYNNVLVGNLEAEMNGDPNDEDFRTLEYQLDHVTNWKQFNGLSIDAATAYEAPHNTDTPVLAGFLNDNDYYGDISGTTVTDQPHVKIDQFKEGNGVNLSPLNLVNSLKFKFKRESHTDENNVTKQVGVYYNEGSGKSINESMAIFMRRLVANINVNITLDNPNLQLSDVSYRRINIPNSVYIIERKTTDCEVNANTGAVTKKGNFPTVKENSPNYADKNPTTGYSSDPEDGWIKTANPYHFSFQHFANKHWAAFPQDYISEKGNIKDDQGEIGREDLNSNKAFTALVGRKGTTEAFNNYASYFIIKMHLIDKSTGRALEAEYTIHEGNTSDELGVSTGYNSDGTPKGNPWDFVTARNINYTYNVVVRGVNSIYHNVEKDGHFSGQGGRVWKIVYANDPRDNKGNPIENDEHKCYYDGDTGSFINAIDYTGGTFAKAIQINCKNPDIAFRLYGYNTDPTDESARHIEGYNYNFTEDSFAYLNTIWPPSVTGFSHYFKDYQSLVDEENDEKIPQCLRAGLKIIEEGTSEEMDIIRFVERINDLKREAAGNDLIKNFSIKVNQTDISGNFPESEVNNYVRAIFIADRNGVYDEDGCSRLVTIFAAAQYPQYFKTFNAVPVYSTEQYEDWRTVWNKNYTTLTDYNHRIHYARSFTNDLDQTWRGNINGIVNLAYRITDNLNITTYKIEVLDEGGNVKKTQIYEEENLVKRDNYFLFPLITSGLSAGTYDVRISLDEESVPVEVTSGNVPITVSKKLVLGEQSWNFSDSFWKNNFIYTSNDLRSSIFGVSGDIIKHGGKDYSKEKNFFIEYYGLELGVFELSSPSPFIATGGYLYTIADYYPNNTDSDLPNDNPDYRNQPTQGNSFRLKFTTSMTGSIKIDMKNSNTNANTKKFTIYLGENLLGQTFGLPAGATYNSASNTYTYTPYPGTQTLLSFPVISRDLQEPHGNEIIIGVVKDVGFFYKVYFE
ncbi:MAG: hypothetical protein J1F12_04965 [Muribaculaceae bacterium]|nr:hypothetical protein [Muribaculaceae bacterium]